MESLLKFFKDLMSEIVLPNFIKLLLSGLDLLKVLNVNFASSLFLRHNFYYFS